MRKIITLFFVLLVSMVAHAELRSGHFFKSLQRENLTEESAVERFNQWFVLPQETQWRKVSQRTDQLGSTRIEYRQYVAGVEVEHSQVLLHVENGFVQTANGTVMEAKKAPARLRRSTMMYRNGTPTDLLGRQLYLVSTEDDYRYATKVLSADGNEWIYTDAETDEVLKRIPTHYSVAAEPVTVKGRSIYSGEVEMNAMHNTENGSYYLYDSQRNIHTLIGAYLPSFEQMVEEKTFTKNFPDIQLPVPEEEMTEEMWNEVKKNNGLDLSNIPMTDYINRNTFYAISTEPYFDSYIFNTITIDKLGYINENENPVNVEASEEQPFILYMEIHYRNTNGIIERVLSKITGYPHVINLKPFFDELPTAGADIYLYSPELDETTGAVLSADQLLVLCFTPDGSGSVTFESPLVKASATYEKGPWSAADIHWGMQQTYDYYKKFFGRNSYDDQGAPICNLFYLPDRKRPVSYPLFTDTNNACAINYGTSQMQYGMGSRDGSYLSMYPAVELSVMAHEFTHMVTGRTANLVYQGESGALNESFSDLMGIGVKKYVRGSSASWTIGDGMMQHVPNLRSMQYPKESLGGILPCPDTYKGEFWVDTKSESDYGGVHTNSGVQNKWFYLLTDGDNGTNDNGYQYNIQGIGIEKSQQIAYRTLTKYATQEAQYADIRLYSLQAAKDLYGEDSDEVKTVELAWKAVGVTESTVPTGIAAVDNGQRTQDDGAVYNLSGQRIGQPTKGLYIQNGKKYMVK